VLRLAIAGAGEASKAQEIRGMTAGNLRRKNGNQTLVFGFPLDKTLERGRGIGEVVSDPIPIPDDASFSFAGEGDAEAGGEDDVVIQSSRRRK
jgi:hypothetical protein